MLCHDWPAPCLPPSDKAELHSCLLNHTIRFCFPLRYGSLQPPRCVCYCQSSSPRPVCSKHWSHPSGPRSICGCHTVRKLSDGSPCSDTADWTFECTHGRLLLTGDQGPSDVKMALYTPEEIISVNWNGCPGPSDEPMASPTKSPSSEAH